LSSSILNALHLLHPVAPAFFWLKLSFFEPLTSFESSSSRYYWALCQRHLRPHWAMRIVSQGESASMDLQSHLSEDPAQLKYRVLDLDSLSVDYRNLAIYMSLNLFPDLAVYMDALDLVS
jgi:hypothetical protein